MAFHLRAQQIERERARQARSVGKLEQLLVPEAPALPSSSLPALRRPWSYSLRRRVYGLRRWLDYLGELEREAGGV